MEAVVLAGGRGTRMGPLTDAVPKPMLPVAGHPLVAHLLSRLAGAGVTHAVLATGYLAEAFAALGDGSKFGLRLTVVAEPEPLGTAGGLGYAARALTGAGPLLVINGDLLSGHDLRAQVAALAPGAAAVLHVREVADPRPYGCVVAGPDGLVTQFVEKPPVALSRLVNAGTYVLDRSLLEGLDPTRVSSLERDLFPDLVAHGRVRAYREQAYFRDVGTPEALAAADADLRAGLVPGAIPCG